MDRIESLKNHFLIATPELNGTIFEHAVIYLFAHDPDGAMGVIINKHHSISWEEVCSQLSIKTGASGNPGVFVGGPVSVNHGYLLYQADHACNHSMTITPDRHVSTSSEQLKEIASHTSCGKKRLFLGYSGWSPGQLDDEIRDNAWLTLAADEDILFDTPADDVYQAVLDRLGIDIHFFSQNAGHA